MAALGRYLQNYSTYHGCFSPLWIGKVYTKLSWLRSILVTIGIAGATAATWAVIFLAGVFFAIMSQS